MPTAGKIRQEFGDEFAEHIVSVDHNVIDDYDREFSFHAVCHPEVKDDGQITIPSEIKDFISDISEDYEVMALGHYVHLHVNISNSQLGIEKKEEVEAKTEQN